MKPVDVIIPVYRGLTQLRRCVESVLDAKQNWPFEITLIDDCTPEAGIGSYLVQLAETSSIRLLTNKSNLGFVASVNLGISQNPDRDVVLLNSDTEVANDWLDRLRRCAHSQPDIGTVTPFSNNATICSFPNFCQDNAAPSGLTPAEVDALFRRVNCGRSVTIPTAVGFCMYIRRDCLAEVGPFDEQRFGRGYGEENDFSRRAVYAGWRNVLCADTYVFHEGATSFGEERFGLQQSAMAAIRELHPDYEAVVADFIRNDPIADLRAAVADVLTSR